MGNTRGPTPAQGSGAGYQRDRKFKRDAKRWRTQRVRLRENVGVVGSKNFLKLGLLNVDGLSPSSLEDVKSALNQKVLDVCVLLETKRRHEDIGSNIKIDGYSVQELRRSDAAGDRGGGGIAFYTRQTDGLLFQEFSPTIADTSLHYVHNERFWLTTESLMLKTAICGLYMGCQYADDRHGTWNDGMLAVIRSEAATLRAKGYRVVFLGDFNAHVGSAIGRGIGGNHDDVNLNGERFLQFLAGDSYLHVNGESNLTTGLWTRQRGHSKSILDYAVISSEHLSTVHSLFIDERGQYGGGSDHNFLFLTLTDKFVKKTRLPRVPTRKRSWNNMDNLNWEPFQAAVTARLGSKSADTMTVDELASFISSTLLSSGEQCVGLRRPAAQTGTRSLPRDLVDELQLKRQLELDWKSKVSGNHADLEEISNCESAFLEQKHKVNELLFSYKNKNRSRIRQLCAGNTTKARKNFWREVSTKVKQSADISAVVDPATGVLKCGIDEIKTEVENHLCRVFQGSFDPVDVAAGAACHPLALNSKLVDHTYCVETSPNLPSINNSCEIDTDPCGWTNRGFSVGEVKKVVSSLKGGKSAGWDTLPNEFLINAPDSLLKWLTILFNRIKAEGTMPRGWNKGRITLIHKSGLREHLLNYRPITVIISLSGLFSKLLNSRLSEVVETHNLLGEVQNGFRKERRMADNSFILDSILMKAKSSKEKLHLCYVDVSKAYDSVNRSILWSKLKSMGFGGEFLSCLQALYTTDSVDSVVNGISSRPVYLRRGLRQGCSLSPLLFALYISEIGSDLTRSLEGFELGGVTFSGLLFADDIVLISKTFNGLETLLTMVKQRCDDLKLLISPSKSNIVTPDDVDSLVLLNEQNEVTLSLSKLLSYKYLGTETTLLMSTTGSKRQQRCILTAKRYKFACFYVGRTGPDVVDTVLATWSNIAIPSMLSGCEVIPFTETTIDEIERIQSQLAKHVLGVPLSTANVCAQTELGLKPFRMLLYQHQLNFYIRLMNLPHSRWVRRVLSDHLEGGWKSPYISYIAKIRQSLQLHYAPPTTSFLRLHLNTWFINKTNLEISRLDLPCVAPIESFTRSRYVVERSGCSTLASFKFANAGLGNRGPRSGRQRTSVCSLCSGCLDEVHVSFVCPLMEDYRRNNTDLVVFRTMCEAGGFLPRLAFRMYVTGLDWRNEPIPLTQYLNRGVILQNLTKEWLCRT